MGLYLLRRNQLHHSSASYCSYAGSPIPFIGSLFRRSMTSLSPSLYYVVLHVKETATFAQLPIEAERVLISSNRKLQDYGISIVLLLNCDD